MPITSCQRQNRTDHFAFPTKSNRPGRVVFTSPIVALVWGKHQRILSASVNDIGIPTLLEILVKLVPSSAIGGNHGANGHPHLKLVILARLDGPVFGQTLDESDGFVEFLLQR